MFANVLPFLVLVCIVSLYAYFVKLMPRTFARSIIRAYGAPFLQISAIAAARIGSGYCRPGVSLFPAKWLFCIFQTLK